MTWIKEQLSKILGGKPEVVGKNEAVKRLLAASQRTR
jgi:hypothetical protein